MSVPHRGGDHHIYGIYLGGSELNDNYELTGTRTYKYSAQRRHPKAIGSLEQALIDARDSTTIPKFNGQLELDKTASSEPEVDKAEFVKLLKDKVKHYGQQSFYVANIDGHAVSLFENYHKLSVEDVINQHTARCNEPAPVPD